jgi:hypothetical protein
VADQLGVTEEPERRVERDPGDQDARLRKRPADHEQAEEDLDPACDAHELEVAERDTELARDVEVRMVGQKGEGEVGVGELLGECHHDQRAARRHAQSPDGLGLVGGRGVARLADLVVRGPAAGAREQDEDRQAEQVDALEDRPEAELEHPDRPGGDQEPRSRSGLPARGHGDRDRDRRRCQGDAGDVCLEVHRRRQVVAQGEQPDERPREVYADRERHLGNEPGQEGDVDARPARRDGADRERQEDRRPEVGQCQALARERPLLGSGSWNHVSCASWSPAIDLPSPPSSADIVTFGPFVPPLTRRRRDEARVRRSGCGGVRPVEG